MSQRFLEVLRRAKSGSLPPRPDDLLRGIDINFADETGRTPLLIASAENIKPLVTVLIGAKANVNAQTKSGHTALHYASEVGHSALVALLLEARADPTLSEHNRGATPLHFAAAHGHVKVCALLALAGADINACDKEKWPPVFWASEAGQMPVVRALVLLSNTGRSATSLNLLLVDANGWRPEALTSPQMVDDPVVSIALGEAREAEARARDNARERSRRAERQRMRAVEAQAAKRRLARARAAGRLELKEPEWVGAVRAAQAKAHEGEDGAGGAVAAAGAGAAAAGGVVGSGRRACKWCGGLPLVDGQTMAAALAAADKARMLGQPQSAPVCLCLQDDSDGAGTAGGGVEDGLWTGETDGDESAEGAGAEGAAAGGARPAWQLEGWRDVPDDVDVDVDDTDSHSDGEGGQVAQGTASSVGSGAARGGGEEGAVQLLSRDRSMVETSRLRAAEAGLVLASAQALLDEARARSEALLAERRRIHSQVLAAKSAARAAGVAQAGAVKPHVTVRPLALGHLQRSSFSGTSGGGSGGRGGLGLAGRETRGTAGKWGS